MTRSTSEQLYHFIDDLESALAYDPGTAFDCDAILLCGVGGSAVSGYFAEDCCLEGSPKPIRLVRYPGLPAWAGPRTLAVVSSYSGNTAETLEMYRQARERGCMVSVVTSGGRLGDEARADGYHLALLPEGMHPRHAIGFMIGYTLAIMRAAGCPDLSESIAAMIPSLREYRDAEAVPEGGMARRLAALFEGRVPVVCAGSYMASVAFRWKTQINENSKFVAFCESSPLFNAHAIKGWAGSRRDNYVLVLLVGDDDGPVLEAASVLDGGGTPTVAVALGGRGHLENMFRAIVLGDYVSMYMAEARGIDPAEVRPVMQMKELLSRTIG